MKAKKIFSSEILFKEEDRTLFVQLIKNHLHIYNHAIDKLLQEDMSVNKFIALVKDYINDENIHPVYPTALYLEMKFLRNKHRRKEAKKKSIMEIQYLTIDVKNGITIDLDTNAVRLKYFFTDLTIKDSIRHINIEEMSYINISYSLSGKILISIFK